jgi:hypothetical protein
MLVVLRDDAGRTKEKSFTDMSAAAKWCMENAEYGITLYPEQAEPEWDIEEWQSTLEYYDNPTTAPGRA